MWVQQVTYQWQHAMKLRPCSSSTDRNLVKQAGISFVCFGAANKEIWRFWHLFSKVWCFSTSFYLWGEYWVEHRARNLREGEAQCAQLSINSAIKEFFQCVFLLDVPGKGLGTASPEPDSKAQRQAREERLVRVGSTDANVPWQAQHMLKSKGVLQILARRGWWG